MPVLKHDFNARGTVHKSFDVQILTLSGELEALDFIESIADDVSDSKRQVLEQFALVSQRITFGGEVVPPADFIAACSSDNYALMINELDAFEKKHVGESS